MIYSDLLAAHSFCSDDAIRAVLPDLVAPFPGLIAKEQKEREKADDELERALNHYTAALQDSIKIVSGTAQ